MLCTPVRAKMAHLCFASPYALLLNAIYCNNCNSWFDDGCGEPNPECLEIFPRSTSSALWVGVLWPICSPYARAPRARAHARTPARPHARTHAPTHARAPASLHARPHARLHARTACTHARAPACTHAHMHARTRTHMHARAHTHTHAHTHTRTGKGSRQAALNFVG